jgi:hypothetical protein
MPWVHHGRHGRCRILSLVLLAACGGPGSNPFDSATSTTGSTTSPSSDGVASTTTGVADTTAADTTEGAPIFDLGPMDIDPPDPPQSCEVVDDLDGVGDCRITAPAESFNPQVQWSWNGGESAVTPLVANLTDDDGNGTIDLCDTPDVVVVTGALAGTIHVLDGATGSEHFSIPSPVHAFVTPAIGDIDGDGEPEIVSATGAGLFGPLALVAFETDGTLMWTSETVWPHDQGGAVGIADFDNDGSPEVYADGAILDANGSVLLQAPAQTGWFLGQRNTATTAADLDGDGDLELVLGQSAYHHDGTVIWNDPSILPGYPQVANLDDDDDPEIIVNNNGGITILQHDGTIAFQDVRPTGDPAGIGNWFRPSTVHDFDDDGLSEFAVSSASHYTVFFRNVTIMWSADVQDASGWAAGTAFDFLGDGGAEAMYADEANLFVFDDAGTPVLGVPRSSKTLIEYPVVADVDNDGSAEIVVVSATNWDGAQTSPTVQVIRDAEDRWIQARRIWNQHTYHVTNVREDSVIPQVEQPSWRELNTFRTNAQIEGGTVCLPPPAG